MAFVQRLRSQSGQLSCIVGVGARAHSTYETFHNTIRDKALERMICRALETFFPAKPSTRS